MHYRKNRQHCVYCRKPENNPENSPMGKYKMGKKKILLLVSCLFCLTGTGYTVQAVSAETFGHRNVQFTRQIAQQEALEKRGEKVITANDVLIQRTVRAYGGNYTRKGESKILIFNEKVYKDFSIQVVNSQYLIIRTDDGTFTMDVVNE
jgi:hypothetical protein